MVASRWGVARTRLILIVLISRGSSYSSWARGVGVMVACSTASQNWRLVCVKRSILIRRKCRPTLWGRHAAAAAVLGGTADLAPGRPLGETEARDGTPWCSSSQSSSGREKDTRGSARWARAFRARRTAALARSSSGDAPDSNGLDRTQSATCSAQSRRSPCTTALAPPPPAWRIAWRWAKTRFPGVTPRRSLHCCTVWQSCSSASMDQATRPCRPAPSLRVRASARVRNDLESWGPASPCPAPWPFASHSSALGPQAATSRRSQSLVIRSMAVSSDQAAGSMSSKRPRSASMSARSTSVSCARSSLQFSSPAHALASASGMRFTIRTSTEPRMRSEIHPRTQVPSLVLKSTRKRTMPDEFSLRSRARTTWCRCTSPRLSDESISMPSRTMAPWSKTDWSQPLQNSGALESRWSLSLGSISGGVAGDRRTSSSPSMSDVVQHQGREAPSRLAASPRWDSTRYQSRPRKAPSTAASSGWSRMRPPVLRIFTRSPLSRGTRRPVLADAAAQARGDVSTSTVEGVNESSAAVQPRVAIRNHRDSRHRPQRRQASS
mmetsp:Transcript_26737/g.77837  ORF Transcript_26737/g.77837 Transcript_26737/m.77837 type:complete len:552 (-) Transcript_26737:2290-3945(-)